MLVESAASAAVRQTVLAGAVGLLLGAAWLLSPSPAQAQIKEPGNHPDYAFELEPHFLLQLDHKPWGSYSDSGWGAGARLSFPIVEQGPIKKINNSMAIGIGLDWGHFSSNCWGWGWGRHPDYGSPGNCSANDLWFPVVLQWNFFLTDVISVFGEPGFAFVHSSWSWWAPCGSGYCEANDSDTNLEPVFFAGGRFRISESASIIARLGTPYFSAGVSWIF